MVSSSELTQKSRKRKQVKLACTNCRKNHTACDNSRPCKRCVAVNEQHLCTDAPKRTKTKRPSNSRNLSSTQSSSCVSDGEGSSDEDRSDSSTHAHTHTHAPSRRRVSPPSATRSNPSAFLADPDVALNDDTDYLPSLYLVEFARRAALELAPSS